MTRYRGGHLGMDELDDLDPYLDHDLMAADLMADDAPLAGVGAGDDGDADKVISLKQLPGYLPRPPAADRVPARYRNIAYGEITATSPSASRQGLANLNQDLLYPHLRGVPPGTRGYPTLVQYDPQGNVVMRILSPDQRRILWQGTLPPIAMPARGGKRQRDSEIERRVRLRVARATGQRFRRHDVHARGADLVPVRTPRRAGRPAQPPPPPRRRAAAGRPGRLRRAAGRFDEFDDLFLEPLGAAY